MTKRQVATPAPGLLEAYAGAFDDLFERRNAREAFRRYLEGLLLPAERNKTLTALANAEPIVGIHAPRVQSLQWFLSESTWDAAALNVRRVALLRQDPGTAPDERGVLVIDETGDRKWGTKTAHIGRQYLGSIGKVDSGVVTVSSLWADERVYWPLHVEPFTPKQHFGKGMNDPAYRTKPQIALELVQQAVTEGSPFRAVVADSFYGENETFRTGLVHLGVGYVLALRPSHAWWAIAGQVGSLHEAARMAAWDGPAAAGDWQPIERSFRDGHVETWWALEVCVGPYGPDRRTRAVVATTDPATLPQHTTWYLVTNLPAPGTERAGAGRPPLADLTEIVRLYGLRNWVEQSYKQVKAALGWSAYQVRSDRAMRRHWALVWCAFSFCWWADEPDGETTTPAFTPLDEQSAERGENQPTAHAGQTATRHVAAGVAPGACLAGAVGHAPALLAWLVRSATTAGTPPSPGHARARPPA
jgi:SRSO17 transposase